MKKRISNIAYLGVHVVAGIIIFVFDLFYKHELFLVLSM